MKKPKLEYLHNEPMIYKYAGQLELYCYELEKKIKVLEKELDKAFDVIGELNNCTNLNSEKYEHCPFEKKCFNYGCVSNKENWKELLIKNGEIK